MVRGVLGSYGDIRVLDFLTHLIPSPPSTATLLRSGGVGALAKTEALFPPTLSHSFLAVPGDWCVSCAQIM